MCTVCDPVMGDEGRLYCAPGVIDAFKSDIVPIASVLVPNQKVFLLGEILVNLRQQRYSNSLIFLVSDRYCKCVSNVQSVAIFKQVRGRVADRLEHRRRERRRACLPRAARQRPPHCGEPNTTTQRDTIAALTAASPHLSRFRFRHALRAAAPM